ncbi:MAG TPA: polysaccharide deacetylase family protein [Candidatus Acidoferrales bacterium]|jgi:peptidoglycan/xylan/chitin deacetylase (PgdA/CDA1 family)|nr:polysaccharide deacetylase family protein [Candidatus Acidoferrales bacterium]
MRKVTLSFDNGPSEATAQVLDCLLQHDVRASFFVLGEKLSDPSNMALVMRAAEEGHWIGNHTFTHTTPLGDLDVKSAVWEFEQTERFLEPLRLKEKLFRPYGRGGGLGRNLLHPAVVEKLRENSYSCVLWNSVPGDWLNPKTWVQAAMSDCRTRDWSLVVLHDLPTRAMDRLDDFIERLKQEDFQLTQEFPDDCVPIRNGRIVRGIDTYLPNSLPESV